MAADLQGCAGVRARSTTRQILGRSVRNVTEVTQFHTSRWGAIWGAIIARHRTTRGDAEPHKSPADLPFSHVEPDRPTQGFSFASRESGSCAGGRRLPLLANLIFLTSLSPCDGTRIGAQLSRVLLWVGDGAYTPRCRAMACGPASGPGRTGPSTAGGSGPPYRR